ncbi:MAG TPA: hypothetical protein VGB64_03620 [Actinomycetota bacterium]
MDQVRTPCSHRGGPEVSVSSVPSGKNETVQFCICTQCRRFWLERDGWLLSRREAIAVLRSWPIDGAMDALAR